MNAQMTAPPVGWVTVAEAAAALSDGIGPGGVRVKRDQIDASNVSRYLARFSDLPQMKSGKFRYCDLDALRAHRATNVLVADKRSSRDVGAPAEPVRRTRDEPIDDIEDTPASSPLQAANLELRQLQIRERRLDLDVREGKLVPDHEVLALLSGVMQAFVGELERQEAAIAQRYGREVALNFRQARKAAQAAAAARIGDVARAHLPPGLSLTAADVAAPAREAVAA